jgi:DNA-binding transcriptional LysR family regulator
MDWSDLNIFLAVAREGSLGAAARRLGQTQPTMGRRIRALEVSLKQQLFQRTPAGFVLTAEGQAVFHHAERMEEEALTMERELAGQDTLFKGHLRVTCSDWIGDYFLVNVLAEYSRQHPEMELELLTDARLLSLSRREADLAIRITPFREVDVISRKLLRIPYGVYVAKKIAVPKFGDGFGSSLITMDESFSRMPDVDWLRKAYPRASVRFRSNSREVQARFCATGGGVAVLPRVVGDSNPALHRIELESTPPYRDCWLGYHRDLRRLGRLRALIDMLVSSAESKSSVFTNSETDNTRAKPRPPKRPTANR